jgi:hypothetical protein
VLPGRTALIAAVLLLYAGTRTEAGTIAISTDVAATVTPSGLSISLKIMNSGDEAARSVVPSVILAGGVPSRGQAVATLAPGQRLDAQIEVPWKEKRSGQWPLTTSVDYADGNGYPLQAVQVALITLGAPAPSLLALLEVDAPALAPSGDIHVRLKSLSARPQQIQLRVVAARGLEVVAPIARLAIGPWADRENVIGLTNHGVLPGSRVPVFVVAEYEDQGEHHASMVHRMLEIRAPKGVSALPAPYYAFISAGVLVALWVAMLVRRRWTRPA